MAQMPQANPIPDKPALHLRGGYLVIASPEDPIEACFAVPAVRALRNGRPNATLAVTTTASLAPIWQRLRRIDHLVIYPENASARHIARDLEDTGVPYESSIAWEPSAAAKAFAKLRIQQRFGFRLRKLTSHLNEPLAFTQPFGPPEHRVRFYLSLVEKLGIDSMLPANFRTPELPPRPVVPRIAIAPGSEFGPSYRWPLERFAEVAQLALESHLEVVVLGHGKAAPEARALAAQLGEKARFLEESRDLAPLLDTLAGCTALLANDGLLPHLAAHLGIPAAAIFGPGNPEVRRPLGRIHGLLNAHVECSPCGLAKCPLDHRCMHELSAHHVSAALANLIKTQS